LAFDFAIDLQGQRPGVYNVGAIRFEIRSPENVPGDERSAVVPVVVNALPADISHAVPFDIRVER
jgi:hypothetical protein